MNTPLFLILVLFCGLFSLWLGRRSATGKEDFFLMGRGLGLFPLAMTMLATQVGGGMLLGAADAAYLHGWKVIFYPLGITLGLVMLALGVGGRLRRLEIGTTAEIFLKVYHSPSLRSCASLLSIVSLFLILVAQGIAARQFLASTGFQTPTFFLVAWTVLIFYTSLGGLRAVVKTDILQAIFIVLALGATALFLKWEGGLVSLSALTTFTSQVPAPYLQWVMLPLLFMFIEQDTGQRCFAAKDSRTVTRAAALVALFQLSISLVPVYFGLAARFLGLEVALGQSVLITAVIAYLPPVLTSCFLCAILVAIVSTADSILCSISSNIGLDFKVGRPALVTILIGILSALCALLFNSVIEMLMFAYSLSVSLLFVPLFLGCLRKRAPFLAALISMIGAGLGFLLVPWLLSSLPIPREVIALGLSLVGYGIGEGLARLRGG